MFVVVFELQDNNLVESGKTLQSKVFCDYLYCRDTEVRTLGFI